jgi:putative pyruvate formate lyase activating enzyme
MASQEMTGPPRRPAYLALLENGELERRVLRALDALGDCTCCPRACHADRLEDEREYCRTGRLARVASWSPHFGEEDPLRGSSGSGTIFFSQCNLRCVFCQNHDISQKNEGSEVSAGELAAMMLELQARGCHNINFVTPSHVVPQLVEAIHVAADSGLRVPLVYNSSAHDAMKSLDLMDGIIDIYMPDFKIWDPEQAKRLLEAGDYPEEARRAIREMHRQVGDLVMDDKGVAVRGLLVRHLVMPDGVEESRAILDWLAKEVSPNTWVNVMGQYRPAHRAAHYEEIDRPVFASEVEDAREHAARLGLRLDVRQPKSFLIR